MIASAANESKRDSENRRKHEKKDRPKKLDESRVHANESEVKSEKKKSNNRRDP